MRARPRLPQRYRWVRASASSGWHASSSLRELASRARTSPGFLSQLERGQVNASVGTLRRLSEELGSHCLTSSPTITHMAHAYSGGQSGQRFTSQTSVPSTCSRRNRCKISRFTPPNSRPAVPQAMPTSTATRKRWSSSSAAAWYSNSTGRGIVSTPGTARSTAARCRTPYTTSATPPREVLWIVSPPTT